MLRPEDLDLLRCPLDPQVRLAQEAEHLVCTRCRARFPVTDDIPRLIAEEAELPAGVASIDQLPCQLEKARTESVPPAG